MENETDDGKTSWRRHEWDWIKEGGTNALGIECGVRQWLSWQGMMQFNSAMI